MRTRGLIFVLSLALWCSTNGHIIRAPGGACHAGFVQCANGNCEPYEALCEEYVTGFETMKPIASTTIAASAVTMTTLTSTQGHASTTTMAGVTGSTGDITADSSTQPYTHSVQTGPGGCKAGFVACPNGECVPFAEMCDDTGGTAATTISALHESSIATTTSSSSGTTVSVSVFTFAPTLSSQPTTVPTSTFTTATTTPIISVTTTLGGPVATTGPDGCHAGFEQCSDGTCEPFHFMCTEHPHVAVIG